MDLSLDNVLFALGLTFLAGSATAIGSLIAFFAKSTNKKFLSASMGFSAGVMIFVSFVEIFPEAKVAFETNNSQSTASWLTAAAFFTGIAIIAIIDNFIPSGENPHEPKSIESMNIREKDEKKLLRIGLFSALAVGIHNLPEGVATFATALSSKEVAIPIVIAIAIHNIPEGIAISVPVYQATGSKKKAFLFSALSGLAEPIGALIAFGVLMSFSNFNQSVMGWIFGIVAGIMVYISLDELLPSAEKFGGHHIAIWGFIVGMAVMSFSLLIIH